MPFLVHSISPLLTVVTFIIAFFFFKFEKHVNELEVDLELFHIFNVSNIQFCSLEKVKYFSSGTISLARISVLVMHNK